MQRSWGSSSKSYHELREWRPWGPPDVDGQGVGVVIGVGKGGSAAAQLPGVELKQNYLIN